MPNTGFMNMWFLKNLVDIYNQRFEVYIENFDIELAKLATLKFIGVKDFAGFQKEYRKETIRSIKVLILKKLRLIIYLHLKVLVFKIYGLDQ